MILRSRRVITPQGERAAAIVVERGVIADVVDYNAPAHVDHDYGELALLPGLVDTHVHINEPGRTEWEGFDTATRAAAAGGVTTLIDMPLNSIPATIDVESLKLKVDAARGRCHVDVGFWGGLVPGNVAVVGELLENGVFGFKAFMVPSGVPEFEWLPPDDLRRAARIMKRIGGVVLVHAEWPYVIEEAALSEDVALGDNRKYDVYLRSRPVEAEIAAIEYVADLVREFGTRMHIVHVACPDALPAIEAVRAEGLPLTAETCPHYLTFAAEHVTDGATAFKCAPPIRDAQRRDMLWHALRRGALDMIVSDHSPCPPVMKQLDSGDFLSAWGGIASLELGLSAVWTGAHQRVFTLSDVVRWMSLAPAQLAGLDGRKGSIARGHDADIVVFDPESTWRVAAKALVQRHKLTPYDGMDLRGSVRATYLRGEKIYDAGTFTGPQGKLLRGMD